MDKLTTAHKIALGGVIVLLVASFLPWYSVRFAGFSASINGWNSGFLAWFGIIVGLGAGVVLALKAFGTQDLRTGGLTAEMIAVILGAVSAVFILLRLLTEASNVSFGLFLGLVGAAAIAFGSFQAMRDTGMSVDDIKKGLGGGGGGPGGGPGGPPRGPSEPPPGP